MSDRDRLRNTSKKVQGKQENTEEKCEYIERGKPTIGQEDCMDRILEVTILFVNAPNQLFMKGGGRCL